jgi:hypothetical protein
MELKVSYSMQVLRSNTRMCWSPVLLLQSAGNPSMGALAGNGALETSLSLAYAFTVMGTSG